MSFDKVYVPNLKGVPMTPDGVGCCGMPTRWTYSEYGRFLSVYGIRNRIHVIFNLASSDDIEGKLNQLYKMRDNGLVDNIDLQELEERLRTMSNVHFYGNGSMAQTMAALEEEAKPTTSQKQLDHLERIRPLAHTDEANAKRRKTREDKKINKLLGL
jgi:hypothetical protein